MFATCGAAFLCDSSVYVHAVRSGASHLDDDMSFPGSSAVQLPVLLHHDDLTLLLHLLHVLLHLVEDAAVILLCYAHKLQRGGRRGGVRAVD